MSDEMIFPQANPTVGVVIGTFAAVPYVHLHLENWRRHYPHIAVLVNDDGSPHAQKIEALCNRYEASFTCNPRRLRQTVGDLSAYVAGFDWAQNQGIEILAKFSRRFIPCFDWVKELQGLAHRTQMPTFSQVCDHFGFGFRTECIAFHCTTWRDSGALDQLRELVRINQPIFVEGFIHQLARKIATDHVCAMARRFMQEHPRPGDRDGYAVWPIMPDRRTTRVHSVLWHDCDGPIDYCRAAALYGLNYRVDEFEDPNQSCGLGEP